MTTNTNNKKERLLAAMDILFLQTGVDSVTLSDIAHMANVPLGNIYYYFKSKDLILKTVLKIRFSQLKIDLINLEEANKTPKNQLRAFVELFLAYPKKNIPEELKNMYKDFIHMKDFNEEPPALGRFITLTLIELEKKQNKHLYNDFAPIMELLTGWCESKFKALDTSYDAKNNTSIFITSLIGTCTFLLNTNIDFSSDAYLKGYISFILKQFGLEDSDKDSNITTLSAWKK